MLLQLLRGAGPRGTRGDAAHRASAAGSCCCDPARRAARADRRLRDASRARHGSTTKATPTPLPAQPAAPRRGAGAGARRFPATRRRSCARPRTRPRLRALLDELARIDAGADYDGTDLDARALCDAAPPRARNVLRWFLRSDGLRAAVRRAARRDARAAAATRGPTRACGCATTARDRLLPRRHRRPCRRPPARFERAWRGEARVACPAARCASCARDGDGSRRSRSPVAAERRTCARAPAASACASRPNGPRRALKKCCARPRLPPWERASRCRSSGAAARWLRSPASASRRHSRRVGEAPAWRVAMAPALEPQSAPPASPRGGSNRR